MSDAAPSIATDQTPDGVVAVLHGHWTAAQLTQPAALRAVSSALQAQKGAAGWDLRPIQSLDHLGALLLWDHWQRQWPARLEADEDQRAVLERVPTAARHRACICRRRVAQYSAAAGA